MENVGACCCGHCPWAQGPCRVPPDGGLSRGRLQLVQEVVQGWDAFFQAFALARLRHHLTRAAGVVKGVTGQDLPVVEHTLGEGLAARVGPQVSSEACRRGITVLTGKLRYVPHSPLAETRNTDSHQRVPESCQMLTPLPYTSPKGSLKGY